MKFAQKKDSAVSPVIGTILLVAITVILVAIIAAVVMPMVGGTSGAATIGIQVTPSETAKTIDIVFTGGDYAKLTSVKVIAGTEDAATVTGLASTAPTLGKIYTFTTNKVDGVQDVKVIGMVNGNEQIIWQGKLTIKEESSS